MNMLRRLTELQLEQQQHDEVAHRDILFLPTQDRIKHMVLHFAKYSGHFADMQGAHDAARFTSTLVDTMIICLASANALGVKLADRVQDSDLRTWGFEKNESTSSNNDLSAYMLSCIVKITGRMAKACEALDHLEGFDYRGTLERGLIAITVVTISVGDMLGLDLAALIRARWSGIERKYTVSKKVMPEGKGDTLRLATKNR